MSDPTLGFVGLGVMGGGMCANLTRKSGLPVIAYDTSFEALDRAAEHGARPVSGLSEVAGAEIVFLSLPSIAEVESVVEVLLGGGARPRVIVDMSTSDVSRTRALAGKVGAQGVTFVDAPVARTRQAANDGTLLITVGAEPADFEKLHPLLACMGSDVVHAGPSGSGQLFKILNNMVVFMNVNALAEALAIGRRAGVDGKSLFEALSMGSADSFILRRTATATMIPDEFPEQAFPTNYAIKDLALALKLAEDVGITASGAHQTMDLLCRTRDAGYGWKYFPAMIRVLEGRAGEEDEA
ncbi:NAD(P)-dependent oxidoreductase [Streptomyces sp. NPDC057363]|uniref:NAD(P)-dependent oxidoreductase n=1 Tax=Streptomyces sp. NPDC057363 TaxID=3346107 RepID=UPI0036339282